MVPFSRLMLSNSSCSLLCFSRAKAAVKPPPAGKRLLQRAERSDSDWSLCSHLSFIFLAWFFLATFCSTADYMRCNLLLSKIQSCLFFVNIPEDIVACLINESVLLAGIMLCSVLTIPFLSIHSMHECLNHLNGNCICSFFPHYFFVKCLVRFCDLFFFSYQKLLRKPKRPG